MRWKKLCELRGSRAVLAPATRGWADKGYSAIALLDEVGLTPDENPLHFMGIAIKNW
jgi:hypothetical protein